MAGEWVATTIGALLAKDGGSIKTGPFGTVLKAKEYSSSGVPLISVGEIACGALRINSKTPRAPEEVVQRLPEYVLEAGDIVFGRKGAVDRSAIVKPEQAGWFLGSDGIRLRPPSTCDARFIAYQLLSPTGREWLVQHATGTTMASLNQAIIERVPIVLPDLEEQRAIAHILGTLDDKIELNRRMNETLEAMARALFKSWFVDFDPVRAKAEGRDTGLPKHLADLFPARLVESELGEIPEGWEVKAVGELAERLPVGDKYEQKTVSPSGSVPVLDQGKSGVIGYHDKEPGVVASMDSPIVVFANHTCNMRLIHFPFSAIQNVLPFIGKAVDTIWIFYATYGKQSFIEYKGHWPDFIIHQIVVPEPGLTREFTRLMRPALRQNWTRGDESRTLVALRDTLLPKLISGELRIREVASIIADTTR